jgi:hypothetical protein
MLLKGPEKMSRKGAGKDVAKASRKWVSQEDVVQVSQWGIAVGRPQMGVVVLVANGYRNRASQMLLY